MAVVIEIYAPNLWEVKLTQPTGLETEEHAEGYPQFKKIIFLKNDKLIVINSYMLGSDIV